MASPLSAGREEAVRELETALEKATDGGLYELDAAGQKWGAYCLANLRGPLLKKGLAITMAISAFHDELKGEAKP